MQHREMKFFWGVCFFEAWTRSRGVLPFIGIFLAVVKGGGGVSERERPAITAKKVNERGAALLRPRGKVAKRGTSECDGRGKRSTQQSGPEKDIFGGERNPEWKGDLKVDEG